MEGKRGKEKRGKEKRGKEKRGKEKIILDTHKIFSYMT